MYKGVYYGKHGKGAVLWWRKVETIIMTFDAFDKYVVTVVKCTKVCFAESMPKDLFLDGKVLLRKLNKYDGVTTLQI